MKKKTDREHDLARKLRIEEKKSFREIEKLTGISKTQICKWAKEEGWPEPQQERKNLRSLGNLSVSNNKIDELTSDLPKVDMNKPIKIIAEEMFRWSGAILQNASRFSLQAAIKLFEVSTKLITSLNITDEERRTLTVYVPEIKEVYEDPPCEEESNDEKFSTG